MYTRIDIIIQDCIDNKKDLSQEMAKSLVEEYSFNFTYLIKYYIKTDKNELTEDLAEFLIKKDYFYFKFLIDYCKKFPDFHLNFELIKYAILNLSNNFNYLIQYYIETDKNELNEDLAYLILKKYPYIFKFLLKYCEKFPNFHLKPELIKNCIPLYFNFQSLMMFYNKHKKDIPNEMQKMLISIKSSYIKYIINHYGYDIYFILENDNISEELILNSINDNLLNIRYFSNFTNKILSNIKFSENCIQDLKTKKENIFFTKCEFINFSNNLKILIRIRKIPFKSEIIENIFNNIRIDEDVNLVLYKQQILDIMPLIKSARNI